MTTARRMGVESSCRVVPIAPSTYYRRRARPLDPTTWLRLPLRTLGCLPGFRVAFSLPFADTQTRIGAANAGIRLILLIVDRTRFFRGQCAIRRLDAIARNTRQGGRFSSVNRRVVGSSPA